MIVSSSSSVRSCPLLSARCRRFPLSLLIQLLKKEEGRKKGLLRLLLPFLPRIFFCSPPVSGLTCCGYGDSFAGSVPLLPDTPTTGRFTICLYICGQTHRSSSSKNSLAHTRSYSHPYTLVLTHAHTHTHTHTHTHAHTHTRAHTKTGRQSLLVCNIAAASVNRRPRSHAQRRVDLRTP